MNTVNAKLILNGLLLKEMMVPDTKDEVLILIKPRSVEMVLSGQACPIWPGLVTFKRSHYNDEVFIVNVSKGIEDKLRMMEKKLETTR